MMIFFAIHFLLEPQAYIFVYKSLVRLIFSYILPVNKTVKNRLFHLLKAAVMNKQTNNCITNNWGEPERAPHLSNGVPRDL